MALALAPELDTPLGSVYGRARDRLEIAKSADKDCFYLLGRTLEWKQLSDAAELKDELTAHGARIRRRAAVYSRSVRHLSRDPARARRQARGTSLALPSRLLASVILRRRIARSRFSKGARRPDRRPGRQKSRQHKVAAVGPRSARMGQTVHRRPGGKLTYNTNVIEV